MTPKSKRKSLVGWTLKKPCYKADKSGWCYINDGKSFIPVCCRKDFGGYINPKVFKKVRITIEEL